MFSRFFFLLGSALLAAAVDTRYWSQDTQADFEKGTRTGVSLRNDGLLSLAPAVKEVADPSLPYLWSLAVAPNGTAYFAGGPSSSKGAIYELPRNGSLRKFADIEGMNVFALALSREGKLFAATSPDGKVYRVSNGAAEVFYDPKAKYIWSLAFLPGGDLLVATGDKGELHRVTSSGTGKVWMKLDEDHIRSLVINAKNEVYVGTEPGGLIVKADASGKGFVVHQSAKREVTALLAAPDGAIYASAIGNKTTANPIFFPTVPLTPTPAPAPAAPSAQTAAPRPPTANPVPSAPNPIPGGSEVVRIEADGSPLRVWTHPNDLVYALSLDSAGKLLLGTGNKGAIYRVESPASFTLLRDLPATQVTAFGRDGNRLLVLAGNIGKVYELSDRAEAQGAFESQVYDVGNFAQWGRIHSKQVAGAGSVTFETRSGNLDRPSQMWSDWAPLTNGRVSSPAARFLQWRAVFRGDGASLSQVDVAYLPKNLAPRVEIVEPTPANYRFPAPSITITPSATTLSLPPIGKPSSAAVAVAQDTSSSPSLTYARGMIGVRWSAADDNGDTLEYTVEIKGENEQSWKLLKDKVKERYLSYDATAFADGRYQIRVTASDQPDNPAAQGLSASLIGPYFLIDNTPPAIRELSGAFSGAKFTLKFKAADSLSVVTKSEISVNGGAWTLVEPSARLADAKELNFSLSLDKPAGATEITVAVRVTDEFDNQSVEKTVIR